MIPHNRPTLGKSEILSTKKIIQSGLISQGDQVKCFESELANILGINSKNVVCVSSGSAAVYIALRMILKKIIQNIKLVFHHTAAPLFGILQKW